MKKLINALMLSAIVIGAAAPANAEVRFGIRIGPPPPPPRFLRLPPPPRPDFVFVPGYWQPRGPRYAWHNGYWTSPPYRGAHWVKPNYTRGRYYAGYWEAGSRGKGNHHR